MRRLWLLGMLLLLTACAEEQSPGLQVSEPKPRPSRSVAIEAGDQSVEFTLPDGTGARYLLHAPASFGSDSQLPLVLVFHGAPGSPREMKRATGFNAIADEENFLVAYPDAFDRSTDVGALIDDVTHRVAVDLGRIYATGFSRGAATTYLLSEDLADRIAAFAPVSGLQYDVTPSGPTSLITFQGSADDFASAWPTMNRQWAQAAGCGDADVTQVTLGSRSARRSSARCRAGTEHVVYGVDGMGHEWPPGASRLIWTFFEHHPLAR